MAKSTVDPVRLAALHWWKMRRPSAWSLAEHMAKPTVNCATPSEQRLATEVARMVKRNAAERARNG